MGCDARPGQSTCCAQATFACSEITPLRLDWHRLSLTLRTSSLSLLSASLLFAPLNMPNAKCQSVSLLDLPVLKTLLPPARLRADCLQFFAAFHPNHPRPRGRANVPGGRGRRRSATQSGQYTRLFQPEARTNHMEFQLWPGRR